MRHPSTNQSRRPVPLRAPVPADASSEAMLDAIQTVGVIDRLLVDECAGQRRHLHVLLGQLTNAINSQREVNGLPSLSEFDKSALQFPQFVAPVESQQAAA